MGPIDRVWVTGDGEYKHVRELTNSHLRRLIRLMEDRKKSCDSKMEKVDGMLTASTPPEELDSLLDHQIDLESNHHNAQDWLIVFQEEKSRRNMVDVSIGVEFK